MQPLWRQTSRFQNTKLWPAVWSLPSYTHPDQNLRPFVSLALACILLTWVCSFLAQSYGSISYLRDQTHPQGKAYQNNETCAYLILNLTMTWQLSLLILHYLRQDAAAGQQRAREYVKWLYNEATADFFWYKLIGIIWKKMGQ